MHNAAPSKSRDGQGNSRWAAPLAVVVAILVGWVAILKSLSESLWVDELHSVWCATGTSGDVGPRAALGNQLSLYFWILRWAGQTFGMSEAVWRAPSAAAWTGLVLLGGWWLGGTAACRARPLALLGLSLIVLDRLQIFYATEARPYALVALVSLMAWSALLAWARCWLLPERSGVITQQARALHDEKHSNGSPLRRWSLACWAAWCVLNPLACWLQPTAVTSVVAQYAFVIGLWIFSRQKRKVANALWPIGLAGSVLLFSMLPALRVLVPVWEHRQRWAAFAAGTGIGDFLQLLPFVPLAGPLAIGALLQSLIAFIRIRFRGRTLAGRHDDHWLGRAVVWLIAEPRDRSSIVNMQEVASAKNQARRNALGLEWWMWLLAWSVPTLTVYLLTWSGIAPLMHRRYVFVAAVPFVLWIVDSAIMLPGRGLRLLVFLAMIAALITHQGSLRVWLDGGWPAAVRGEDWRGAVEWINTQTSPDQPVIVFCASNLIEGTGDIPGDPMLREYLTLPLRSIYRVQAAKQLLPLANDPARWSSSIAAATAVAEPNALWLIVRCSPAGLERRLQASGLIASGRRDFGGVQVAHGLRAAQDVHASKDAGFNKTP